MTLNCYIRILSISSSPHKSTQPLFCNPYLQYLASTSQMHFILHTNVMVRIEIVQNNFSNTLILMTVSIRLYI